MGNRIIEIDLAEDECKELLELCGRNRITVKELLEGFIGDLIDGRYSHGSDERELASAWFERCGYGYGNDSLLTNILDAGFEPEFYIDALDELGEYQFELDKMLTEPLECNAAQLAAIKENIRLQQEYINDRREMYLPRGFDINNQEELESQEKEVRSWVAERNKLMERR